MRTIRFMLVTILAVAAPDEASPLRSSPAGLKTRAAQQQSDVNDIGEYYGFGEMEVIKLDWGVHSPVVADFDGDGRNDIAIANNVKARIELLIQKEALGPGEPELAVDANDFDINALVVSSRFAKHNITVSERIYSMVCGDLNADGRPDLAYYGEPRGLYILLQTGEKDRPGRELPLHWQRRKKIQIDDGLPTAKALISTDLNSDRRDDLIVCAHDGVYIVLQKEDGTLAEPLKHPSIARVLSAAAGDLNGDRIKDLVVQTNDAEYPVEVRFGQAGGQLGPCVRFFIEQPFTLALEDIDGRPGDELLAIAAASKRLICYRLAGRAQADADWPMLFYPLASGEAASRRDMVLADVDGDKLTDVVISDPASAELILYRQHKKTGLSEAVRFPVFADVQQLSAADIDNDGRMEIGVLSIREKTCGISRFENERLFFPKPVASEGEPLAMELYDIDADGAADCVYVSRSTDDARWLRVSYSIAHQQAQPQDANAAVQLKKLASSPDGLKVVDVDRDGLADVLIFVRYELPILVRQTARRRFEIVEPDGAQASLIKEASARSIAVANVDGRPGDEILIAQNNFARGMVYSSDQGWRIVDQYNARSSESRIAAVGVFELETVAGEYGPAIFLLDGYRGQIQILTAGQDHTYRFDRQIDVGSWNVGGAIKMLSAAVAGTASKSILLFDGEKFAVVMPPGTTGTERLEQQFNYETKIKDGSYGYMTAGDINSDGVPDIIMVEYNRNHIEILALGDRPAPTPAMRFKVFEQKSYREGDRSGRTGVEPRELKVADVTGDGRPDLVAVVHDRIIIYPQD